MLIWRICDINFGRSIGRESEAAALGSVLDFEKGGEMDDTRSLFLRLLELVTFRILHSLSYLILSIHSHP